MSRATPDDQLKFLLSCVRYANNGKIDFVEVAKECGVVSKGAAAKRYERLLKANGIHPNGGPAERPSPSAPKQKSRAEIARSADAKRRKIESEAFSMEADDEDDTKPYFKPEPSDVPHIKPEPGAGFLPSTWSPMSVPPQQPFFHRTTVPQMMVHQQPYGPPYPLMYQNPPSRYSYAGPHPMYVPTPHSAPPTRHSFVVPIQKPIETKPQQSSSSVVSEEQIDSMFEEFCAQDLFKQPNFDAAPAADRPALTSTEAEAISVPDPAPTNEPRLSPHTVDATAALTLENRPLTTPTKEEQPPPPTTPTDQTPGPILPAPATEQPLGSAIENSILIAD